MITMDNIVENDDFKGRYTLSLSTYGEETFDDFVGQEQYDLLIDMLGDELYNDFDTTPTDQKWVDLLNGITYTDLNDNVRNWRGLKVLMIPFIYSKFVMFNRDKAVQSGNVKPVFENATPLTEYEIKTLSYKRWNEFIKIWKEVYDFLYTNEEDYTEFYDYFKRKFNKAIALKSNIT